ncbi:uncharacterized protein [Rutidosis leptorrhynchoides]|uniref:uncharacterized protein n=1 Tax=Rutidosis leptorrhynchoides TaxID=125765 RepID=UPI003A9A37AA
MTSLVWRLLTCKHSLWVKWIHVYILPSHYFWTLPIIASASWSWHKLLQIRPTIRQHFKYQIGNGNNLSAMFDNWCSMGPLDEIVQMDDITVANLTRAYVSDIVTNGSFSWPNGWDQKYPMLTVIPVSMLSDEDDLLRWKGADGSTSSFSVAHVWDTIRTHGVEVEWFREVWCWVRKLIRLKIDCTDWKGYVQSLSHMAKRNCARVVVAKICLAATVYFIWQERNGRFFKKAHCSVDQLFKLIKPNVRLKLMTIRLKNSIRAKEMKEDWHIG